MWSSYSVPARETMHNALPGHPRNAYAVIYPDGEDQILFSPLHTSLARKVPPSLPYPGMSKCRVRIKAKKLEKANQMQKGVWPPSGHATRASKKA